MEKNSIVNNLLDAVDIIAQGAVKDLKYDTTIECVVTSTEKCEKGVYSVEYEDAIFEAYSRDRYYINDIVYVMIPQGDFSNQKFITGRRVDAVSYEKDFNLQMPFDDFINLKPLEGVSTEEISGFTANRPDKDVNTLLWSYETSEDNIISIFPRLAISVNVQSLLGSYRPISGQYGLKLVIEGETFNPQSPVREEAFLKNSDMYGNTYAFMIPVVQQKVFDISSLNKLKSIKIYFWQDYNFYSATERIPYQQVWGDFVGPNLFLTGIEVALGMTSKDANEEKVLLYSHDTLKFNQDDYTKDLKVSWIYNNREKKQFELISSKDQLGILGDDGEPTEVYWYRYCYGAGYNGTTKNNLSYQLGGPNWEPLSTPENPFERKCTLDPLKNMEQFKVIIDGPRGKFISEPLIFTNIIDAEGLETERIANDNFQIFFSHQDKEGHWIEDTMAPNFFVYDENGWSLLNSEGVRYSDIFYKAELKEKIKGEYCPLMFKEEPLRNPVGGEKVTLQWSGIINNKSLIKSSSIQEDGSILFQIQDFYSPEDHNNVLAVDCNIENVFHQVITKELIFGKAFTDGSQYTASVRMSSPNQNYAILGQPFVLTLSVHDAKGNLLKEGSYKATWNLISADTQKSQEDLRKIYFNKVESSQGSIFKATLKNNLDLLKQVPAFNITILIDGTYPLTIKYGMAIGSKSDYVVFCPDRVEFLSDGSIPIYDKSLFDVYVNKDLKQKKFPTWELTDPTKKFLLFAYKEDPKDENSRVQYKLIFDSNLNHWDRSMETQYLILKGYQEGWQFAQAVVLDRNLYSSSLVNNWNGSLLIDKANDAIASRMIASGTKNKDNLFTGVIMGDMSAKADESLESPGIYGFRKGSQSFGFKTDGTGFIGEAEKGQIKFDGNTSTIRNGSGSFYINLNPTNTDTFNGDPYFLYAKSPKGSVSGAFEKFKDFLKDSEHDYFVVDPSKGIFTTGGIFARYGKISNTWTIDENSLTYEKNNAKIYMGKENEANPYSISAGTIGEELNPITHINFGIKCDGTIFSQKGTIGGWKIDANSIRSSSDNVILNSNGTIQLGTLNPDKTISGTIVVGGTALAGTVLEEFSKDFSTYTSNKADSEEGEKKSYTYWGGATAEVGAIQYQQKVTATKVPFFTKYKVINALSFIDNTIFQEKNQKIGMSFNTAQPEKEGNGSLSQDLFLYPLLSKTEKTEAWLGLESARWNIWADAIGANIVDSKAVYGEQIFLNHSQVATETWVSDQLSTLEKAIKSVAGSSQQGVEKAKSMALSLASATREDVQALVALLNEKSFLTKISRAEKGNAFVVNEGTFTMGQASKETSDETIAYLSNCSVSLSSNPVAIITLDSSHISVPSEPSGGINPYLVTGFFFKEEDGVITLSMNFIGKETESHSFDIASTALYKKKVEENNVLAGKNFILEQTNSSLEQANSNLEKTNKNLKNEISTLDKEISTLEKEKKGLKEDIINLNAEITNLNTEIGTLKGKIYILEQKIAQLEGAGKK